MTRLFTTLALLAAGFAHGAEAHDEVKGKTLEARAPFILKQEKGVLILNGTFPLKRLYCSICSSATANTQMIELGGMLAQALR